MPEYIKNTGTHGEMIMKISPNSTQVEFQIRVKSVIANASTLVPWAYTVDGKTYWSQTNISVGITTAQLVGLAAITKSGTVGFQIGNTDTTILGGPTGLYQTVTIPEPPAPTPGPDPTPQPDLGYGKIKIRSGDRHLDATPWVNVNGTWLPVTPWLKVEGRWQKML